MENKSVSMFHNVNDEISEIHSESEFSQCRPWFSNEMNLIFTVGVESPMYLSRSSIKFSPANVAVKNIKKLHCNFAPLVVCTWGETTFMICDRGTNNYALIEMGSLELGVLFCNFIKLSAMFYHMEIILYVT